MRKLFYWIPTFFFYIVFGLILAIFHGLQVVGRTMGYQVHKVVVDGMTFCLNAALIIVGSPPRMRMLTSSLPENKPLIIVANHQSMFDIPSIGWMFRRYHPKYIAKKKLAKGIPSVSYNIRHGGSIAIDRDNPEEALNQIRQMAHYLNETARSVVIFPEGTRSWDGNMKPFKLNGLITLLQEMPDALIVPVVMKNYWKIGRYRMKPIPFAMNLSCTALPVVERANSNEETAAIIKSKIEAYVKTS